VVSVDGVQVTAPPPARSPIRRLAGKAAGAVSGQLSQALGSFLLQALAARELGAAGLGMFALLYGAIVLGTAVSSGLIGDSLTVLARQDRAIRVALQNWCLIVSSGAGLIAAAVGFASGALSIGVALLFGAVTTVFIIEDALRRALMAILKFWRLPVVDFTSLVVSLGYLAAASAAGGRATLGQFLMALLLGQAFAALVAVPLLPRNERPILAGRSGQMRLVFSFGAWRAAQQSVRPALLTAARLVVTVVAGVAAYGQLEAARVYMAPALLVVTGMGSMLLPVWVRQRAAGLATLLRRADRTAMGLFALTLLLGAVGTLALPYLGGLLTDGKYRIASAAVFGWAFYAASTAAVTPYGTLAALQGKQGRVMVLRLVEPLIALIALLVFLLVFGLTPTWTPYALSIGAVLSGMGIRHRILVPMARLARPTHHGSARKAFGFANVLPRAVGSRRRSSRPAAQ
jgi:O-antigen/teichoic acid export membrane protein